MRASAFLMLLVACGPLLAVPARPGWIDGEIEGRSFRYRMVGDEFCNWAETEEGGTLLMDRAGRWTWAEPDGEGGIRPGARLFRADEAVPASSLHLRPSSEWLAEVVGGRRLLRDGAASAREGERIEGQWNLLLILIHYPDQQPRFEPADFDAMMNEPGYRGTGSFNDYYQDLSYGRYGTVSVVTQWVEAERPHDEYGYNQGFQVARSLVVEAVQAVDEEVDFTQFDNSGNGRVDALLIVHSGSGAEEGDQSNIWSHRWGLGGQSLELDGVEIDDYTMQPEVQGGGQAAIGVYVHEFGHNLGLPDLYDTDYSSSGLGTWCVMSGGSWGGDAGGSAAVPVSFSAFCRMSLGWATLREPEIELLDHPLPASWLSDEIVRLSLPGTEQYFLAENRRRVGWDRHQPGEGLMVYHVDPTVWGNEDENHPLVDLEQADGNRDLNHGLSGDASDPFPGTDDVRGFNDDSVPSSRPYGGDPGGLAIERIGDAGDSLVASFFQSFQHQDLRWDGWEVVEDEDGDLWPSPGETVGLTLRLLNRGAPVDGLELRLSSGEGIEVLEGVHDLPSVPAGAFDSGALPFRVRFAEDLAPGHLSLRIESEDAGGWIQPLTGDVVVGRCDVLLMVEPGAQALAHWLSEPLASLGFSVETRRADGAALADFESYSRLLWMTGTEVDPLDSAEQAAIDAYLLAGGRVMLGGQHWVESLDGQISADWGVAPGPAYEGVALVDGRGEGGLFDDGERLLLFGGAGAWNQQLPATSLAVDDEAAVPFRWRNTELPAALRLLRDGPDAQGRLLLLGFSPEAIHGSGAALPREELLTRGWHWLDTGELTGVDEPVSRPESLRPRLAPNPFNPTTRLSFELATGQQVEIRVWNLQGQLVLQRDLGRLSAGAQRVELDMGNRASGLYLVEVRPSNQPPQRLRALLLR